MRTVTIVIKGIETIFAYFLNVHNEVYDVYTC